MASNALPDSLDKLFTLAEDMADGLSDHEVAVGVKQNVLAVFEPDLIVAQTTETQYGESRSAKKPFTTAVIIADSNGKAFIALTHDVLKPFLGADYSDSWIATGFPNNSLAVPSTVAERQALLEALGTYLTAHAAQQNAPLNVTPARANTLFQALRTARNNLTGHLTVIGQKKIPRDAAEIALRKRMRGLIDELGQLLPDDSPLWLAFGLHRPADPEVPDAPDAPVLTATSSGQVLADWMDEARALRYRVWKQVMGVDDHFIAVATVLDSDATLTLPPGATVRIRITATNDTGESAPGPFTEIVVV